MEPERLAQPVLEIAPVAEVDRPRLAGEEHERRRRDGRLRGVEELRPAALDERRRPGAPSTSISEPVELAGRDALAALAPDVDRELEHAPDALAGLGADRDDRGEVEERHLVADPLDVLVEGLVGLLVDEVPLVDRDDQALALLDDVAGDVGVLGGQALDGVDDEDRDVGPRDRRSARSVE